MFRQSDIRVVVADRNFLFRRGMRALLQEAPGIQVMGEAANVDEVIEAVDRHTPHFLLLDHELSGKNFDVVTHVGREYPEVRVLLLVSATNAPTTSDAKDTGALGCIPKQAPVAELVNAIRNAAHSYSSSIMNLAKVHDQAILPAQPVRPDVRGLLTPREQEVVSLLMRAATSREIAATLGLSLKTVETHKFNLMRKLDVHSRSELIQLAAREQIIPYASESLRR
jgi:two-component system response regulator NreC